MKLEITHLPFSALTPDQLYEIIALRLEVFVVEQNCAYQDLDDKDQGAVHVMGRNAQGKLLSYCRILAPGISYDGYSSIGRVITAGSVRGSGEGKRLMQYAIRLTCGLYPSVPIKISAQCYALAFYESLGFAAVGEEYLEDDIPHKAMILYA